MQRAIWELKAVNDIRLNLFPEALPRDVFLGLLMALLFHVYTTEMFMSLLKFIVYVQGQ